MGGFDPFNKDPKIANINKYKLNWGGKINLYYINVSIGEYISWNVRHYKLILLLKKIYDKLTKK